MESEAAILMELKRELEIMDRIIYKYTNQHRHGKYFQKLKIVRNKIKFIVNNNCKHNVDVNYIEYVEHLAVSTAEIFTILLGRSYFMPFALVCISIMAKIVSVLTDLKCLMLKKNGEKTMDTIGNTTKAMKYNKTMDSNSDNDNNIEMFKDTSDEQHDIMAINTTRATSKPVNLLETSIDSLLSHNHNTTDIGGDGEYDGEQYTNRKRKKKKKKKKKKDRKKIKLNDEMSNNRDEIDDIFGF